VGVNPDMPADVRLAAWNQAVDALPTIAHQRRCGLIVLLDFNPQSLP